MRQRPLPSLLLLLQLQLQAACRASAFNHGRSPPAVRGSRGASPALGAGGFLDGLLDSFGFPGGGADGAGGGGGGGAYGENGGNTNEVVRVVDGIRHKRLGGSDMVVSEVGLGTQRWGSADVNAPDKDECFRMMDLAIRDTGGAVNLIDVAEQYPIPSDSSRPEGTTERIIGEWLAQGGSERRDQVVLATKVTGGSRVTRRGIIDAVDGSLRRLQTDRLDVLQTHWPARYSPQSNWGQSLQYRSEMQGAYGPFADFDEITATMGGLVLQGKIRGYGFCNDNAVGLVACAEAAKRLNVPPPCVLQNDFSLINRRIEENGVAEASSPYHYNTGFFAYNALAGGVLTGKYLDELPSWERQPSKAQSSSGDAFGSTPGSSNNGSGGKPFRRFDDASWGRTLYRYRSEPADAATRAYADIARRYGLGRAWEKSPSSPSPSSGALTDPALAELALRWCCEREAVTSVLLGSSNAAQLAQALDVFRAVSSSSSSSSSSSDGDDGNGGGGSMGGALPAELMWEVDQVHMRNRLPIFSSTDIASVGRGGPGAGGIGEPVP